MDSSTDDSSSEEEDFDGVYESHFQHFQQWEIKSPEDASEAVAEAEVQGSPIDTEVCSEKLESAVTSLPERDYRLFTKIVLTK